MKWLVGTLFSFLIASHAHAHIILELPVGSPNPETGEAMVLPETYGEVLKAVALNHRSRLTRRNFPSVSINRIWRSRTPGVLIAGRMRKMLIERKTALVFRSPARAAHFEELFAQDPHQNIYLVYDASKAKGYFVPMVSEDDLWLGIRRYNSSMNAKMVKLSEFLDQQSLCDSFLQAL